MVCAWCVCGGSVLVPFIGECMTDNNCRQTEQQHATLSRALAAWENAAFPLLKTGAKTIAMSRHKH